MILGFSYICSFGIQYISFSKSKNPSEAKKSNRIMPLCNWIFCCILLVDVTQHRKFLKVNHSQHIFSLPNHLKKNTKCNKVTLGAVTQCVIWRMCLKRYALYWNHNKWKPELWCEIRPLLVMILIDGVPLQTHCSYTAL